MCVCVWVGDWVVVFTCRCGYAVRVRACCGCAVVCVYCVCVCVWLEVCGFVYDYVCVCVCVSETERERVCVQVLHFSFEQSNRFLEIWYELCTITGNSNSVFMIPYNPQKQHGVQIINTHL